MSGQLPESIIELSDLINSMEGVEIINFKGNDDFLAVVLTIESAVSLLLINYCTQAANVKLDSWANCEPNDRSALENPGKAVHYRIMAKTQLEYKSTAVKDFQLLGICIARWLNIFGKIDKTKTNYYMDIWGGGHVDT